MSTTLQELDLERERNPGQAEDDRERLIRRLQRRHFWVYNVVPFVGFVCALVSLRWLPIGAVEVSLLAGMWALSMIGMSLGLHRYFAHHAFETSRRGRAVLAVLGCMAAQGPLVSWVSVHRRHHERSDKPGDPALPEPRPPRARGGFATLRGLWHAHVGWLTNHEYPNPVHYAPELLRDRTIGGSPATTSSGSRSGSSIPDRARAASLTAPGSELFQGFLWGGLVRMFVVDHSVLSINSFSHAFGGHDFETDDHSRNNAWVALPTFGESWQNNHHAFASSAAIGLRWWQVDFGYWLIAGPGETGARVAGAPPHRGDDEGEAGAEMTHGTDGDGRTEDAGRRDGGLVSRPEAADGGGDRGVPRVLPVEAARDRRRRGSRTGVSFSRYGLDSSASIAMTSELSDWLGRELDPTINYSYPTVAALAKHLAG